MLLIKVLLRKKKKKRVAFLHSKLRVLPICSQKKPLINLCQKLSENFYPSTRCILDCTEIFIEMPTSYRCQSATFSKYKHHNTAKTLIGIALSGSVTFASEMTKDSRISNLLEPGDSIMAGKGIDIDDLPEGIKFNITLFLRGNTQPELKDELQTRRTASVCVHLERAIAQIKNYRILQSLFQLSMVFDFNKTWVICSYLVNLLPPLIAEKN